MEIFFKLKERNTTVGKEITGGITTFLSMVYILALHPGMLEKCGNGMTFNAVFTATAVSAGIATLVMAFIANLPIALAPGLGLNAFFTYTIVLGEGYSWQFALTAVFVEGIIFILLSLFGVREAIINSIPATLKKAVAVGIGLFITIIGLVNAGILTTNGGTPVSYVALNGANPSALVAVIGLIITIVLYTLKVPGAILIAIAATTVIGIPFKVTTIPENFKAISTPSAPLFFKFAFGEAFSSGTMFIKFLTVIFTFLFTDMFDTLGTLMGVAEQGNLKDEKGNIINSKKALMADSVGTVLGACLGTSTVTSFVESTSGIAAGARTGLASAVTGVLFLLSLFFTDIFALVPAAATAPALIFVGFLMMQSICEINFKEPTEGIPAFLAIITMPFAYSISAGIAWGMISYVIAKCAGKKAKEIPVATWILAAVFLANMIFEALK